MSDTTTGDRLAATLESTTQLDLWEAATAIARACEAESSRRKGELRVHVRRDAVLVGYEAAPAARSITGTWRARSSDLLAGHWLVAVRFPTGDPARRERPVEMRLTNWVMDSGGRREPRAGYERLTRAIWSAVADEA